MKISRFLQYRLKSLFVVVVVTAIAMAFGTWLLQKQREERLQRDSFAVLTNKAETWHFKMRDEIEARKGWDFSTWSSGGYLATDFVNPHFSYTSGCRSSNRVEPAWKIEISIRSEMSEYPDNHLLLIEYPPGDENREFAEMAESYLASKTVTTQLIEVPEAND